MPEHPAKRPGVNLLRLALLMLLLVALSLTLAWVSTGFAGIENWVSFLLALLLATGLLAGGWLALRREALPRQLAFLLVGAALLRLALGAIWTVTLPGAGLLI